MAIYQRDAARVGNEVRLARSFYNDGVLYDPDQVNQVEIWDTRYDTEYEHDNPGSLLKDTIFGSRIVLQDIADSAYGVLGLLPTVTTQTTLFVVEFEQEFTNQTSIDFTHNLNDRYPVVTVYDTNGYQILPDEIISLNVNTIRVNFSIPLSGFVDIVGATEQVSNLTTDLVKRYSTTFSNTTQVIVNHNLNDDSPIVSVYDYNYSKIFAAEVTIIDANTVRVIFPIPMTGTIIVTGGGRGVSSTGFGESAKVYGTKSELFDIHSGENDTLLISVDNSANQTVTLTQKFNATASDIVTAINSQLVGGIAELYQTDKILIRTSSIGSGSSIKLRTVANPAYNEIGLAIGDYSGLGEPPSSVVGSKSGGFAITASSFQLKINWDGLGDVTIPLSLGIQRGGASIAAEINSIVNAAYATTNVEYADVSSLRQLRFKAVSSIVISSIVNDCYGELGFTPASYGTSVIGTTIEYYVITVTNKYMTFVVNYNNTPISVELTVGNRTLAQILAEINAAIAVELLQDTVVAEASTGVFAGRLTMRVLISDGIIRDSVGQYHVLYEVPYEFVSNGVLWKKFLDVWYYFPNDSYTTPIADDTAYFVVYPNKFFLDTGYSQYDFSFNLEKDLFFKGEKRVVICDLQALPKYKTPMTNDWILPIANAQYKILTYDNIELVPFTPIEIATGRDLRFTLDTRSSDWRDGIYKIVYEVGLPNGEIVRSAGMKFRLTAK